MSQPTSSRIPRLIAAYLGLDLALAGLHLANRLLDGPSEKLTQLLQPGNQQTFAGWNSSTQLFLAAMLAALYASAGPIRSRGPRVSRRIWLLPLVLLGLSIDQATGIHRWALRWVSAHDADSASNLIAMLRAGADATLVLLPAIAVAGVALFLAGALGQRTGRKYLASAGFMGLQGGLAAWAPGSWPMASALAQFAGMLAATLALWGSWSALESQDLLSRIFPRAAHGGETLAAQPARPSGNGLLTFNLVAAALLVASIWFPRGLPTRIDGNLTVTGNVGTPGRIALGTPKPGDALHIRDSGATPLQTSLSLDTSADTIISGEVVEPRLRRRSVRYLTDGGLRWSIDVDGVAELGDNSGSILGINRYADDGSYLGTEFVILRENGNVGLAAGGGTVVIGGGDLFSPPAYALGVGGGVSIGSGFSKDHAAPENGVLVEGALAVGTAEPRELLTVQGNVFSSGTVVTSGVRLLPPSPMPASETLTAEEAIGTLTALRPVRFLGAGAATGDLGVLAGSADVSGGVNLAEVVAALTSVVQEQQRALQTLESQVREMRAAARKD